VQATNLFTISLGEFPNAKKYHLQEKNNSNAEIVCRHAFSTR